MITMDIFSTCLEIAKNYGVSGIIGAICIIIVYWLFTRSNEKIKTDYIKKFEEANESNIKSIEGLVSKLSEFVLNNNSQMLKLIESSIEHNKEIASTDHEIALKDRMNISNEINDIIECARIQAGGDRAIVIELHNSNVNLNGDPFAKYSVNFESIERGIMPISNKYKGLPYSNISAICGELVKRQVIRIKNIDELGKKYIISQAYLLSEGIHSVVTTGIYNSANKLTGLFAICFNGNITSYCSDNIVLDASTKISTLLNVKNHES